MGPLLLAFFLGCNGPADTPSLYATQDKAPSYTWDSIEAMDHMGATLADDGIHFTLYSGRATRIDLLLFDDPESEYPTQQFKMTQVNDLWTLYVEGIGLGQHYGYIAWGPNWEFDPDWSPGRIEGYKADIDAEGNRFNPNKLLIDPYAKALHRDHDWSKGSTASGPARTQSTYAAASKAIVFRSEYEWSASESSWLSQREDPEMPGHALSDLIIYEVHAKGFTQNAASGVDHPGTYRGMGEKAAYLKDLGITAIEVMPVHEKPLDGGYWGYNNLNFFAPELTYSSAFTQRNEPSEVVDEFKWMVDQLHQNGIEVILDVVYNHTGEGGLWREKLYQNDVNLDPGTSSAAINLDPKEVAGLYSYRGIDNYNYYALSDDFQTYFNNTGVGNQTRPNNKPMRRLIKDSLKYYVEEMHVDGFRFDLAGILGETDLNYNQWDDPANTVLQEIVDLPVFQQRNIRVIAEPWTAGGWYGPLIGAYPASSNLEGYGWHEWNARYRDWWRAFFNEDGWKLNSKEANADGGFVLTGSQSYYDWNGRKPYTSVNFIAAHDGFTLYDLFSYNQKQNSCGVLNPVCCSDPASAWCDQESGDSNNRSRDWGTDNEPFKRQMMRNAFTAMMISHGTPMLLGGDEWMRSQYGNNNAYSTQADNEWNWFRWGEWQAENATERHRMHDFVRHMTAFRKSHTYALSPSSWGGGMSHAWKDQWNSDTVDWSSKHVLLHYYDDGRELGPELAIFINMEDYPIDFTLPGGRQWAKVIDTQAWFDDEPFFNENPELNRSKTVNYLETPQPAEGTYGVSGRSIVIFEQVLP